MVVTSDVPRCRDPDKFAEATDRIVTKAVEQIAAEQAAASARASSPSPELRAPSTVQRPKVRVQIAVRVLGSAG